MSKRQTTKQNKNTETVFEADSIILNEAKYLEKAEMVDEPDSNILNETKYLETVEVVTYKFKPYDIYCAGKENCKVKITNLGFGDVRDMLTNKIIFTGEFALFEKTAVLTSTSFPEIRIEYLK